MAKVFVVLIKGFLILLILFLIFCIAYFFKSRMPFQFSEKYSIHQYFPFNYLARGNVIDASQNEFFMKEDFNSLGYLSRWYHIWAKEPAKVTLKISNTGYNSTACLSIISSSEKAWSLSPTADVKVNSGDSFMFQTDILLASDGHSAGLRIVGYNDKKETIFPKMIISDFSALKGEWQNLKTIFVIPDGVQYITPRIRGQGIGQFKIDNIELVKK